MKTNISEKDLDDIASKFASLTTESIKTIGEAHTVNMLEKIKFGIFYIDVQQAEKENMKEAFKQIFSKIKDSQINKDL